MTGQHPDRETLDTAKDLTGALNDVAAEVRRLRTYGRRNRWFIVFDIVLTVALAVSTFIAIGASQSARDAQASAAAARAAVSLAQQDSRNLCLSSNVARAQQIGLWDYLFTIAGKPGTAQAAKLDAEFKHHLAVVFAPRDCSNPNPRTP